MCLMLLGNLKNSQIFTEDNSGQYFNSAFKLSCCKLQPICLRLHVTKLSHSLKQELFGVKFSFGKISII